MALLETWRKLAYETEMDQKNASEFWGSYFNQEKAIYEQILADSDTVVKGTVKELAEKFGVEVLLMTGFLDGINDSLKTPNPIETMDENTEVSLDYDKEKLYYNMVGCKADWLYELPQWDNLLDEQTRKELWHSLIPKKTPLDDGIDLDFFAKQFELSGSQIKEILLNAAYIAVSDNKPLGNEQIKEAITWNYIKYGKQLTKDDFGYLA